MQIYISAPYCAGTAFTITGFLNILTILHNVKVKVCKANISKFPTLSAYYFLLTLIVRLSEIGLTDKNIIL